MDQTMENQGIADQAIVDQNSLDQKNLDQAKKDKEQLLSRLRAKPELTAMVTEAMDNPGIIKALVELASTEASSVKYACTKLIRLVSEQRPELVYPYFEEIAKWLHHQNSFIKWDGIMTLANLSGVDEGNQFGPIYEDYFDLIGDPQMITAGNAIGSAWKIVLAKPELESDITRRLLAVTDIVYLNKGEPSPECNRIACGHVLDCFDHYFEHSENRTAMLRFAQSQLESSRTAVAKKAELFLHRHLGNRKKP